MQFMSKLEQEALRFGEEQAEENEYFSHID